MSESRKNSPTRRVLLAGLAAALVGTGGYLTWDGYAHPTFEAAPMPDKPFSVISPTPRPTSSAAITTMQVARPSTVNIPELGITAPFDPVRNANGSMGLPDDARRIGYNLDAAHLAAKDGTLLFAGHVSYHGVRGALYQLSSVTPGMVAYVVDSDGTTSEWVATGLTSYVKADLPQDVFATTGRRRMVLVTCGGPVSQSGNYWLHRDNVVATFALVRELPPRAGAAATATSP